MIILITNDDGIFSAGITSLKNTLENLGELWIVAPDRERNAVGRSITLHRPLKIEELSPKRIAINGTPSDCVNIAVNVLLPKRPDLVISGINMGVNLGDNILYSGTIGAAFEAAILGISSFAISLKATGDKFIFQPAANFARKIAQKILQNGMPPDTLLNVNVPDTDGNEVLSYMITEQGKPIYNDSNPVIVCKDPRGMKYYWLGRDSVKFKKTGNSDFEAIEQKIASITPLRTNLTHYNDVERLKNWKI